MPCWKGVKSAIGLSLNKVTPTGEACQEKCKLRIGKNYFPLKLPSCFTEPHGPALYSICYDSVCLSVTSNTGVGGQNRDSIVLLRRPLKCFWPWPGREGLSPAVVGLEVEQVISRWRSSSEPWPRLGHPTHLRPETAYRKWKVTVKGVFRYFQFWRLLRQSWLEAVESCLNHFQGLLPGSSGLSYILRPDLTWSFWKRILGAYQC